MSSLVEDLWIFSKDGLPLVEIFHNTELNPALLGVFLSAIKTLTKKVGGKELKCSST